jgi:hypothetical protein
MINFVIFNINLKKLIKKHFRADEGDEDYRNVLKK